MSESKKYLTSIDIVRVVAALGICLYHYSHALSPVGSWANTAFAYGYLGVQMFFVVTGLLVPLSFFKKNYALTDFGAMFRKRFWRLEPAFWVSVGLFVLMDILAMFTGHAAEVQPFSLIGFLLNFLHLNAIFGLPWLRDLYWYLAIDWQFYLLCCLFIPFIAFQNRLARFATLGVLTAAAWFLPASLAWLPMYLMPFIAGIVLFFHFADLQKLPETLLLLVLVLFATYRHSGITHGVAVGLTVGIILFLHHSSAVITFLSNISYSFYLTHLFSGWTFASLVRLFLPTADGWLILVSTGISIGFAWLFYQKIELPLAEWAAKPVGSKKVGS